MCFFKTILKPFVHDILVPSMVWAIAIISITSCIHRNGQEDPAPALTLGPPTFVPAAVTLERPTSVRFATKARGVTVPPATLMLQEFEPVAGWVSVTELLDDGQNGDLFAGDLVYTRQLLVPATEEGQILYRIIEPKSGVVSSENALEVTRFPVGPDPQKGEAVKVKETGEVFAAEQVLVSFLPKVSAERNRGCRKC